MYSSHLRILAYIIDQHYFQTTDCIIKLLKNDECILSCATCESLINTNIYYEGHVRRYLKSQCEIDNISMESVLLENFQKVSWVMLKYDYDITANS